MVSTARRYPTQRWLSHIHLSRRLSRSIADGSMTSFVSHQEARPRSLAVCCQSCFVQTAVLSGAFPSKITAAWSET